MLVDGVKVIDDDGWALVLPDPEEPGDPRLGRGGTTSPGIERVWPRAYADRICGAAGLTVTGGGTGAAVR